MWTRKELKEKAKISFKANYWKSVLVALILLLVSGGLNGSNSGSGVKFNINDSEETGNVIEEDDSLSPIDIETDISDEGNTNFNFQIDPPADKAEAVAMTGALIFSVIVVVLVVFAIAFASSAFLLCPLEVGCRHFFTKNLHEKASLKLLSKGFDTNYLNVVKTSFLVELYICLWSLLFVIPGIIKIYEYRMVPYILGNNPDIDAKEAFRLSKEMMKGNKWDAFVLDLSFIGWSLLGVLTLGLLSVFYVNPYKAQTDAALYERLSNCNDANDNLVQEENYVEVE